ncbi:MAG: Mini-ribonuclease 3 [Clostridiales bacterium]|nr:Mini-ribonuclease 3 [Clostridiales bacterium]
MLFEFNSLDNKTAKTMNPQVLAFVGDAVYSLYIRHWIVLTDNSKVKDLHSHVTNFVKASGQSNFIEKLLPLFNEDEMSVFKRGRNYKTISTAKNASVIDYKRATGLEAVFGYLYLSGQRDRLNEILSMSIGEKDEG